MEKLQRLLNEITELTNIIRTESPELYRFLNENPLTIPATDIPEINIKIMQNYLDSLKELLKHYLATRKKNS